MPPETLIAFDDALTARGDTVTELTSAQLDEFRTLMAAWHNDWINGADDPAVAQDIYEDCLALIAAS